MPRFRTRSAGPALAVTCLLLAGCGNTMDRLSNVGQPPPLTQPSNPIERPDYRPVTMPMPAPKLPAAQPASLWRPGSRHFLKDQRASTTGDILTVVIDLRESARINNKTTRSRANAEGLKTPSLLGFETKYANLLPGAVNPNSLLDLNATTKNEGQGAVDRSENINLRVAALVTQVLPNGNLVIAGRQEVRVNFEVRELQIAGVVRPEDIQSDNSISHDKIAEARIAYGGRGQISDVQQPRYGQQVLDIILPF